jgi:hypothetical protein
MSWSIQTFRLASSLEDPGLFCAMDQLTLGGQPLLVKTKLGFSILPLDQLQQVFDAAYGPNTGIDIASRLSCLQSIADALGSRDMSRAVLLSLMLRLPDIDPDGMSRLRTISGDGVTKYDDNESRDQRGRWTSGGGTNLLPGNIATGQKSIPLPSGRWPDRHRENPNVVPVQGSGAGLPFPFPLPPLMPGNPLNPQKPKTPYVFPPTASPQSGTQQAANDNATTQARATTDKDAKTCPDPSFEADSKDRTAGQLLYQSQISGLSLGMGVKLNGVKFDGCRESDGTMLEAKTSSSTWFSSMPIEVFQTVGGYIETRNQAFRQMLAAGSRKIEWHFSDSGAAWFWKNEFARIGYRITVKHTPFIPTAVKIAL